jgi:hypothetical protein
VNPNLRKVMDGLKHHNSIFTNPKLDATLRVGKTANKIIRTKTSMLKLIKNASSNDLYSYTIAIEQN